MQAFIVFLLLIAPVVAYGFVVWSQGKLFVSVPRGFWTAAMLCPPALVVFVLLSSFGKFGDVVISAEGLKFAFSPLEQQSATIGGSAVADDFLIKGLPQNFIEMRDRGDGIEILRMVDSDPASRPGIRRFGLVRLTRSGDPAPQSCPTYSDAYALSEAQNAELEVQGVKFEIDPQAQAVKGPSGHWTKIPTRTNEFFFGTVNIWKQNGPSIRIYPLVELTTDIDSTIDSDTTQPSIGTFFYRQCGVFNDKLHIAVMDADATLKVDGQIVRGPGKLHLLDDESPASGTLVTLGNGQRYELLALLRPGDRIGLEAFRIDYFDRRGGDQRRSRVQIRRSFSIASENQQEVSIALDTPFPIRVDSKRKQASQRELQAGTTEFDRFLIVGAESDQFLPADASILRFPMIGRPVANDLFAQLRFPAGEDRARLTTQGSFNEPMKYGDQRWIGDDKSLQIRVEKQYFPVGAAVFVIVVVLIQLWLALSKDGDASLVRGSPVTGLTLVTLELLLAFRLINAIAGAIMEPQLTPETWTAYAAYALLPFIVCRVFALQKSTLREDLVNWGGLKQDVLPSMLLGLLVAYILESFAVVTGLFELTAVVVALSVLVPLLCVFTAAVLRGGLRLVKFANSRGAGLFLIGFAAVAVARLLGFLAFGLKERLYFPGVGQLAISVLYNPVFLLALAATVSLTQRGIRSFAAPFRSVTAGRVKRRALIEMWVQNEWKCRALLYGMMFFAMGCVIPVLASDSGVILIYTFPAVLLIAVHGAIVWRRGPHQPVRKGMMRAFTPEVGFFVPIASFCGIMFLLGVAQYLPTTGRLADALFSSDFGRNIEDISEMSDQEAVAFIKEQVDTRTNFLRVWRVIAPERLQFAGTREAENLIVVSKVMERYSSTGLTGEGYLSMPLPTVMRDTQLTDNAPAVHVLGPFGILGALGLLGAVTGWSVVVTLAAISIWQRWRQQATTALFMSFSMLASWLFMAAGTYMFLCNIGVLPFTGKNVYLISALSLSDLLEGTMLLVLAVAPILWLQNTKSEASR